MPHAYSRAVRSRSARAAELLGHFFYNTQTDSLQDLGSPRAHSDLHTILFCARSVDPDYVVNPVMVCRSCLDYVDAGGAPLGVGYIN